MKKIHLLNVEDSVEDSLEIIEAITSMGIDLEYKRVDSLENLENELNQNSYDIIVSDFALIGFNGLDVLNLVKRINSDIPVIMISGVASEEYAVEALKGGADNFISKSNLQRLLPSIDKALHEAKLIKESKLAEQHFIASEKKFETLSEAASDAIIILDKNHRITFWNNAASSIFEFKKDNVINCEISSILSAESSQSFYDYCSIDKDTPFKTEISGGLLDLTGKKASGELFPIAFSLSFNVVGNEINAICIVRDVSVYIEIERELKESRDDFREILENMQDVFYRTDIHGNLILTNNSGVKLLGYDSEKEILGKNVATDFYAYPEERDEFLRVLRKKGSVDNYEVKIKKKNGDILTVLVSSHYYKDKNGKVLGVEGVFSDITSRKIVEEELELRVEIEKSVSRISSLFVGNKDFNYAINELLEFLKDLSISKVTALYTIHESTQRVVCSNEVSGNNIMDPMEERVYSLQDINVLHSNLKLNKPIQINIDEKEKVELLNDICLLTNQKDIQSCVLLPLVLETTVKGFIILYTDSIGKSLNLANYHTYNLLLEIATYAIQQKQSEEKTNRLATAVEQSEEAIVITDIEANIQYVNPSFERITGYSYEEAVGENPRLLQSGEHDSDFYKKIWEMVVEGRTWKGRLKNKRKDGTIYEEEASISPVRNKDGVIVNYVSVKRDVTELALMETQLRQAQKLESIGQLAAGIAHEINTPIQYVGDNLRFLEDSFDGILQVIDYLTEKSQGVTSNQDREKVLEYLLEQIKELDFDFLRDEIPGAIRQSIEGSERVAKIVGAMKEFSHPGTNEKVAVDINKSIQSTITVARNEWKYVSDVHTDFETGMMMVPCLQADLNQVILNIIVNAAHSIEEKIGDSPDTKGTITIKTYEESDYAVIELSDTGKGIPQGNIQRIFDPFFTTKDVGKGTGQGLTIAHNVIVEKHGGEIEVESEEGSGTTFTIKLPLSV